MCVATGPPIRGDRISQSQSHIPPKPLPPLSTPSPKQLAPDKETNKSQLDAGDTDAGGNISTHTGRVDPPRKGPPHTSHQGYERRFPLSPTLFLLYYDILLRETKERCPEAQLYVFVDDIAVRAPTKETLLRTLDTLHDVAYTMGLRFNKDKIEVYHWTKDYNLEPITWQHQLIPVRPPIMTYLGHVLAHPTQEDTAWPWLPRNCTTT